ncbi:MAG: acyl-CoA thioesterase [Bacteroidetes bacterium]|nr:acyl-CoA thioesterase [Bacteroidota bacterium]
MFVYNTKIKFSNCDPAGVIYFAEVFNLAHETYELFLLNNKTKVDYFISNEIALPIIKAESLFTSAISLHDDIKIELRVLEIRESSYEIEYKIIGDDGRIKAKVKTVHVCIGKGDRSKVSIPPDLAMYLNEHLAE